MPQFIVHTAISLGIRQGGNGGVEAVGNQPPVDATVIVRHRCSVSVPQRSRRVLQVGGHLPPTNRPASGCGTVTRRDLLTAV